jgi:hypothetical protein
MASGVHKDIERWQQKKRVANQARYKAVNRLIAEHAEEFDRYYAEEAAKLGVNPSGRRTLGVPGLMVVSDAG